LRCRPDQAHRLQNARDITAVAIERRHVRRAVAGVEQRVRDHPMPLTQFIYTRLDDVFLALGGDHQVQQ
jgi:hypothetical protein